MSAFELTEKWQATLLIIGLVFLMAVIFWPSNIYGTVQSREWEIIADIEEFRRVHETGNPPNDAYNITEEQQCNMVYEPDPNLQPRFQTKCTTHHEYDVDRWVKVDTVRQWGTNHNPVLTDPVLNHIENEYGNQRLAYPHTTFFIIINFGDETKRCDISKTRWLAVSSGDKIRAKHIKLLGIQCHLEFGGTP